MISRPAGIRYMSNIRTFKIVSIRGVSESPEFLLIAVAPDGTETPGLAHYSTFEQAEAAKAEQEQRDRMLAEQKI